jgi:hypothetical protein
MLRVRPVTQVFAVVVFCFYSYDTRFQTKCGAPREAHRIGRELYALATTLAVSSFTDDLLSRAETHRWGWRAPADSGFARRADCGAVAA